MDEGARRGVSGAGVKVVTLYDDTTFWEFSFWLLGFLRLAEQGAIAVRFARGRDCPIPHDARRWDSLTFSVSDGGRERMALIDNRDGADSFREDALASVDRYFKFNHCPAIQASMGLARRDKVRPTGFYCPVRIDPPWRVPLALAHFARAVVQAQPTYSIQTLKDIRMALRYRWYWHNLRFPFYEHYVDELATGTPSRWDLFWNVTFWPGEMDRATAQRTKILEMLKEIALAQRLSISAGFVDSPKAREHALALTMIPTLPHKAYLREVAQSWSSIVSRGLKACFSHRIAEHLMLRRFAFMERFQNESYAPLEEGKHVVFFEPDLSDFREKVTYYLQRKDEMMTMANAARAHFDAHHAPERQADYMIRTLLDTP